jgi:chromosome segregation ATPase
MPDEVFERLERVEVQRADYIRVLSNHTAAIAANTGTLANMQQMLGQLVAEVAAVRQDVTGVAGRLESLEDRFDRLDAFLRSKLNGGERC